ncbi:Probable inactive dual specificity protein phosphatase-like At4g18593 [Linum perenne]
MATESMNLETVAQVLPAGNDTGREAVTTDVEKLELVYRCKKCRRIVASDDNIVTHERGKGQESFKWKKRSSEPSGKAPAECSSIFVEPMKWMETGCRKALSGRSFYASGARRSWVRSTGLECSATVVLGLILHFNSTKAA